ncbi:hypothetical protein [Streptomyces sp. Je 1-369]|uniref:hypothetical protein n=1 Tax=Streptomyces sp. Je 1-369 TaxID=2966192 RepID=UPI002286849E|nr:hypothetical protein [Streptomyces sp. Je 1-369]WAL99589.1 hypothetical protein NOO62_37035 [Streptomyces sp. Je 1-369]
MIIGTMAAGSARARWLLVGLLLTGGCWSAAGPSAADGPTANGLALEVTVNTRPGLGALNPGIRTGAAVVKSYRLINRGGADLHDVRVHDPAMPGAAIRCVGGLDRVPMLAGLRSAYCTATTPARPGSWVGDVRAVGQQPYLRAMVQATARSGYAGVGAALGLTETARVTGPDRAEVRYVVANHGNKPVHGVRVTDAALPAERIGCAGSAQPVVAHLAPGARATCVVVVRRAPGTYESRGQADGSDLLRTLDTRGGAVAPPRLTARSSARFTLRVPPPVARVPRPPRPAAVAPRRPPAPPPPPPARPRIAPPLPGPPLIALFPLPPPPPGIAAPVIGPVGPAPPPGAGAGLAPGVFPPGALPPGALPPGALPPGAVPPGAVPPGALPPGILPPGVARNQVQPPKKNKSRTERRDERRTERRTEPRRSLAGRLIRRDRTPTGLGMLAALFLILLPAAIAAAVFGSRRL